MRVQGFGYGVDQDLAFDDAVAEARFSSGHGGLVPSLADCDPSQIVVMRQIPMSKVSAQLLSATFPLEAGIVGAWPIAADRAFSRVRTTLVVDDVALEMPSEEGEVRMLTNPLRDALFPDGLAAGSEVEQVVMLRRRVRTKPTVVAAKGRCKAVYQARVVQTGEIVAQGPTVTAARRAALVALKAGLVSGPEVLDIDVVAFVTAAGALPFSRISRQRVLQIGRFRTVVVTPRNPATLVTTGWVFAADSAARTVPEVS